MTGNNPQSGSQKDQDRNRQEGMNPADRDRSAEKQKQQPSKPADSKY